MANNFPALKPSLSLDMVNGIYVDSRVTFTRAGTRTFFGQEVVKAEENLLIRSQEFDNAAWIKTNTSVTANTEVAPDGTTTADQVIENTGDQARDVRQAAAYAAGQYTVSISAKLSGTRVLRLVILSNADLSLARCDFDLSAGTASTPIAVGTTGLSAVIVDQGGGWYRCSLTSTHATTLTRVLARPVPSVDYAADGVYTGDGTSGFYIWGAQLEFRSSLTAYTATTTQPITRYQRLLKTAAANEWPREFDPVTGECLGRSVWESRTNLLLRSEEFDNASWTKVRSSITANQIIAPDGTLTADKLVENTDNNTHTLSQSATLTAVSNTISFYAKAGERSWVSVLNNTISNASAHFNLSSGVVGTVGSAATASIVSVGNGWYRCSMVFTGFAGSNQLLIRLGSADNTPSYTGDGYSGIYIWGAQLEAGAFATPYIPTVASQVTRVADSAVMTGVNFSSWFNPSEGTLFVDCVPGTVGATKGLASIDNGTTVNRIQTVLLSNAFASFIVVSGSVSQAGGVSATTYPSGQLQISASYKTNDFKFSSNGAAVVADTDGLVPAQVDRLDIGGRYGSDKINGYIKRLTYYPQALTSANLQAVTR